MLFDLTPNSIMVVGGAPNVNTAKLFVRYLLGEKDGSGEGAKPYRTIGTWSIRNDIEDGNSISLDDMNYVELDNSYIHSNRESIASFFLGLLD